MTSEENGVAELLVGGWPTRLFDRLGLCWSVKMTARTESAGPNPVYLGSAFRSHR
jgi:hypothetical protein